MLTAKPTEHLTGITLEGAFDDFYELMECIYRITGLEEDYDDLYWGVKKRLLGVCYDVRHAFMGDRNVLMVDNGVHDEMKKWHGVLLPEKNVHYSVEVLFPEALFVAFSVPEMSLHSIGYYGSAARKRQIKETLPDHVIYK